MCRGLCLSIQHHPFNPALGIPTHFQVALSFEASVVVLPLPSSASAAAASSTADRWSAVVLRPRSASPMLLSRRSTAAACALLLLSCPAFADPPRKKLSSARGCTAARLRACERQRSCWGVLQGAAASSRVAIGAQGTGNAYSRGDGAAQVPKKVVNVRKIRRSGELAPVCCAAERHRPALHAAAAVCSLHAALCLELLQLRLEQGIGMHAATCSAAMNRRAAMLRQMVGQRLAGSSIAGLGRLEHDLRVREGTVAALQCSTMSPTLPVCLLAPRHLMALASSGTQLAEQRKGSSTASATSSGAMAPWPAAGM